MYVYLNSYKGLWTVGFYSPNGEWIPESDWKSSEQAAARVSWLNGGSRPSLPINIEDVVNAISDIYHH